MRILLVVYDNDSYTNWFPQGLGYIASVLRKAGHEICIYNQDVYHWPESHLEEYLNKESFDAVGIGACGGYYQYRKTLALCSAVNRVKKRPLLILGGHLASPEPAYFLKKTSADVVVIGEAELTIVELLEALERKKDLSRVKGIAYLNSGECHVTQRRELISEIDELPFPAWDMFPIDHYAMLRMPNIQVNERCMPVLSGRGCTFTCNFCYRMDEGFRPRSSNAIIEEIQILKKDYGIKYIAFSDELLMSSIERTVELCEAFIKARLNIKWDCNGRLNYARPDVLKLMKEAGCVFINYGIESVDDKALKNMRKALTYKVIVQGVENTLASKISPGLNIIFGNIGEDREVLKRDVEFLLKYDDHAQLRTIRPVTPYPGAPLYYYAIKKGLIKDCEDFYERKHLNSDLMTVNFTDMSDSEFYEALFEANKILIEKYFESQKNKVLEEARALFLERDASFRGFRR